MRNRPVQQGAKLEEWLHLAQRASLDLSLMAVMCKKMKIIRVLIRF